MSPWIPVIITIIVATVSVVGNLLVLSHSLGKMRAQQDGNKELTSAFQTFNKTLVDALMQRMNGVDQFITRAATESADVKARLVAAERAVDTVPKLREAFADLKARFDAHMDRQHAEFEATRRAIESINRQFGSLVAHGAGHLVEMNKDGGAG